MGTRGTFIPITIRVNLLILATLVVGIGTITVFLAGSFADNLNKTNEDSLRRQARAIYASIETIMLPGQASLASSLFARYASDNNVRVFMFRSSGTEAFVDNQTIKNVNERLNKMLFTERPNPPAPRQVAEEALFQRAVKQPQNDASIFTQTEGNATFARMYKPLINIPKCTACHGSDHTVRGVLDIRFDITATLEQQKNAIMAAALFFVLTVFASALMLSRFMIASIIRPVQLIGSVCAVVSNGDFSRKVQIRNTDEIGELGKTVNQMIDGLVERFKLAKYVSSSTIGSLTAGEEGQRVARTLFFSDIRGFTSFSEKQSAEDVVSSLNQVLNLQTEIIHKHGGDIDKYVGDEIMAIFKGDLSCINAVKAAVEIQSIIPSSNFNKSRLSVGIGLNHGEVIEGMIGSDKRADFTVIGDNVNLAARLCSAAGKEEIIISESVLEELKQHKTLLPKITLHGPINLKVKGKEAEQHIYKVKGA